MMLQLQLLITGLKVHVIGLKNLILLKKQDGSIFIV